MSVVLLLDEYTLCFSFCPWVCDNIPLPVALVSPPTKWRNGSVLEQVTCINMCMMQKLFLPRIGVGQVEAEGVFGENRSSVEMQLVCQCSIMLGFVCHNTDYSYLRTCAC